VAVVSFRLLGGHSLESETVATQLRTHARHLQANARRARRSRGEELAGSPSQVGIGVGVEGCHDVASNVIVVGELGEVLVGEVGGAVQFLSREQAEDLSLLALTAGVRRR
jgi:hypothetical protein